MRCDKCKREFEEIRIDEHHLHPRFMDNSKGEGKKIYLCRRCHNILHSIIPSIIWKQLDDFQKKEVTRIITSFSNKWIGEESDDSRTT